MKQYKVQGLPNNSFIEGPKHSAPHVIAHQEAIIVEDIDRVTVKENSHLIITDLQTNPQQIQTIDIKPGQYEIPDLYNYARDMGRRSDLLTISPNNKANYAKAQADTIAIYKQYKDMHDSVLRGASYNESSTKSSNFKNPRSSGVRLESSDGVVMVQEKGDDINSSYKIVQGQEIPEGSTVRTVNFKKQQTLTFDDNGKTKIFTFPVIDQSVQGSWGLSFDSIKAALPASSQISMSQDGNPPRGDTYVADTLVTGRGTVKNKMWMIIALILIIILIVITTYWMTKNYYGGNSTPTPTPAPVVSPTPA